MSIAQARSALMRAEIALSGVNEKLAKWARKTPRQRSDNKGIIGSLKVQKARYQAQVTAAQQNLDKAIQRESTPKEPPKPPVPETPSPVLPPSAPVAPPPSAAPPPPTMPPTGGTPTPPTLPDAPPPVGTQPGTGAPVEPGQTPGQGGHLPPNYTPPPGSRDWLGHVLTPTDSLLPQQLERSGPIRRVKPINELFSNPIQGVMPGQGETALSRALRSGAGTPSGGM